MSDTDIDYSDNEIDTDDEALDAADSAHEEERDEEEMLHTPIPREKRYNTITGSALSVPALNDTVRMLRQRRGLAMSLARYLASALRKKR
jgi:hypothetical protein